GTKNARRRIQLNVIASGPPLPQNVGLYNGSKLSGTVFADNGAGGGTANNGAQDGTEAGTAGVLVQGAGAATRTTRTSGAGLYTLCNPAGTSSDITVTHPGPPGYRAETGSAGG